MNKEYETGYTMGTIQGEKDSNLLIPPYPYKDGEEYFSAGYKNGYLMRYTKGLSAKLSASSNENIKHIIAERLDEVSNCMKLENEKLNQK